MTQDSTSAMRMTGTGSQGASAPVERLLERVHPDWCFMRDAQLTNHLVSILDAVLNEPNTLPAPENILRAFHQNPARVRVLIVGQDPYPTPGHAVGLSFSAELPEGEPFPKSLANIFTEYEQDLGLPRPERADLSPWIDQGVLLLNRVLSVRARAAGSHAGRGWEDITAAAVQQVARNPRFAAILWGKQAQQLAGIIGPQRCVQSPHPSPLSAYRGFFGSRPFTRANEILAAQGANPVDWDLTH